MASSEDLSLTGTDAADAGSSVALTEAEEDLELPSSSGHSAGAPGGKVVLTKESSIKGIKIATDHDDDEDEGGREEEYAAPMHLHALRTPARLKGARSRSSSRSRPGSRKNSVSPPRKGETGKGELIAGGIHLSPSHSVDSSLDGAVAIDAHSSQGSLGGDSLVDPDILLDRLGMRDLDPNASKEEIQELLRMHISSSGLKGLPTLNERMSEETMDDVHAFQDLRPSRKSSSSAAGEPESKVVQNMREMLAKGNLSNSAVMGSMSYLLNTLDECEEEGDDEVLVDIPEGIVVGSGKRPGRDTTCAVASPDAIDQDDEEGDAEVEVPTSIMRELDVCDAKRRLGHQETSMATAPSNLDVSEGDR